MDNRRVYERHPLKIKTKVLSADAKNPFEATFNTKNFSLGGVFIEGSTSLKIGDAVSLEFSLPYSSNRLSLAGMVVYAIKESMLSRDDITKRNMSPGLGIKFINISQDNAKMISDLLPTDEVGLFVSGYISNSPLAQKKLDFFESCKLINKWETRKKTSD